MASGLCEASQGAQCVWERLEGTHKAVHTKSDAHRRRRRRRRCGPPVGRTRGTSPWCLLALPGLPTTERGVSVPTRPTKHHGGGSPLCLLPSSPGPHSAHAPPPYMLLEPPRGMALGGGAERRLHFRHGPPPPLGERDTVSRVWALSPPAAAGWAAFGRQVSGAWSVA